MHGMFDDFEDIRIRLDSKREEHRDLNAVIDQLLHGQVSDIMQMQRLKKRKLLLKDEIAKLEAMLIPDIIA